MFEVDERVAPDGDPDRNLNDLRANLLDLVPVVAHLMDVTAADLPGACRRYADELSDVTGDGVLDVVHLGLGDDGHTASWPPGDPVIDVRDADVAAHPALSRTGPDDPDRPRGQPARSVMFLAAGEGKTEMVKRLVARDMSIPASHVRADASLLVDESAASSL